MSEAHADDADVLLEAKLDVFHELEDPVVVVEGIVSGAGYENAVEGGGGWVFCIVDYVVGGEGEAVIRGAFCRGEFESLCCGCEERCKDTAVATISCLSTIERSVALEDCNAEGQGGHCVDGIQCKEGKLRVGLISKTK